MRTVIKLVIFISLLSIFAYGQSTSVTLQVTDTPDNQTWNNGSWQVQLQGPIGSNANIFTINGTGAVVPNQRQSGALSGTGGASLTLTSSTSISPTGSRWVFTVCPQASSPCNTSSIFIFGTAQTVNISPPAIRINISAVNTNIVPLAYADGEMTSGIGQMYFNLPSGLLHICTATLCNGSGFVTISGTGISGSGTTTILPIWTGSGAIGNSNESESGNIFLIGTSGGYASTSSGNSLWAGNNQGSNSWTPPGFPTGLTWGFGAGTDNILRCYTATATLCLTPVSFGLTGFSGNGLFMQTSTCNTSVNGDVPVYDGSGNICDSGILLSGIGGGNVSNSGSQTAGFYPLWVDTTHITNGNCDSNVTNANGFTCSDTNGIFGTSFTSVPPSGKAGMMAWNGNTVNQTIPTNKFAWGGFSSTSATAYGLQPSNTAPSGNQILVFPTPTSGWTQGIWFSLQGTDPNIMTSGTISGTGASLCTDANGGATTSGCSGGSSNFQFGMVTTNMTAQSTATPTAITNMAWNISASKNYKLDCVILATFVVSATISFDLNGPGANPTSYSLGAVFNTTTTTPLDPGDVFNAGSWGTATTQSNAPGAASRTIRVNAEIENITASGTQLQLRTIGNGTNNFTILKDSSCILTQLN